MKHDEKNYSVRSQMMRQGEKDSETLLQRKPQD